MEMGYADYGGGPRRAHADEGRHGGDADGSGAVSVRDAGHPGGPAGRRRRGTDHPAGHGQAARRRDGGGVHRQRHLARVRLIEATEGQLVEVRLKQRGRRAAASRCTGTASTSPTPRTASPGSRRTRSGRRRRTPTAGWPPTPARSGTTPTSSPTEQVAEGLLGAIVIAAPQAPLHRPGDVLALAHLYAGGATLNGRARHPARRGPARPAGAGAAGQHRQRPARCGQRAVPRASAVDGYDVNEPTEVTGRALVLPAGGRVDLRVTVPDGRVRRPGHPRRHRPDLGPPEGHARRPGPAGGAGRPALLRQPRAGALRRQPRRTAPSSTPSASGPASCAASPACGGSSTAGSA